MPDPYAARGIPRRPAAVETRSVRDTVLGRLAELGADEDELAQVAEDWDLVDPDECTEPDCWTAAKRDALVYAGDNELAAMLARARTEYETGTHDEDEQAALDFQRAVEAAKVEAADRIGGNVDSVLGWVGDDVVRASAVWELEHAGGAPRKTLVEPLGAMIDAARDPGTGDDLPPGRIVAVLLASGIAEADADEGAMRLAEAGTVIAAVFGADAVDVEEAIYAGLVGEPDPLVAYGINIPPVTSDDVSTADLVTARAQVVLSAAQALSSALPDVETDQSPSDEPEAVSGDESAESGDVG